MKFIFILLLMALTLIFPIKFRYGRVTRVDNS